MKTNGLRNKKPQCARAAWRAWGYPSTEQGWLAIVRWHRATWRK